MSKESLKKATASASICGDDLSCCRPAVRRAYTELRQCGQPERYAFEAAMAVFRYHHPAADAATGGTGGRRMGLRRRQALNEQRPTPRAEASPSISIHVSSCLL